MEHTNADTKDSIFLVCVCRELHGGLYTTWHRVLCVRLDPESGAQAQVRRSEPTKHHNRLDDMLKPQYFFSTSVLAGGF